METQISDHLKQLNNGRLRVKIYIQKKIKSNDLLRFIFHQNHKSRILNFGSVSHFSSK
jgi:hypothetical protein